MTKFVKEGPNPPADAQVGDVWTDEVSFKRVLSRGGAWENVNLGSTHPDEVVDNGQQQQDTGSEAVVEQQDDESTSGAGETEEGDGGNGEVPGSTGDGEQQDPVLTPEEGSEGEGVDEDGPAVV